MMRVGSVLKCFKLKRIKSYILFIYQLVMFSVLLVLSDTHGKQKHHALKSVFATHIEFESET